MICQNRGVYRGKVYTPYFQGATWLGRDLRVIDKGVPTGVVAITHAVIGFAAYAT